MDNRYLFLVIWIAFGLVLLVLMGLGWRGLRRRQAAVARPAGVPASIGSTLGTFAGKYVATTVAGDPYDRIAVHGLAFRGPVAVTLASDGVILGLAERELWIPLADVTGVGRATWTIDRVVERDGLATLGWRLGDREVETALRLDDTAAFEAAAQHLLAGRTTP